MLDTYGRICQQLVVAGRFGYGQGFNTYSSTAGPDKTRASALNDLAFAWLDDNLANA